VSDLTKPTHTPTVRVDLPKDQGRLGGVGWFFEKPVRINIENRNSEVRFYGMDVGEKPSVSVECTWYDGELVEMKRLGPEPFPNPEPVAYRPKAW